MDKRWSKSEWTEGKGEGEEKTGMVRDVAKKEKERKRKKKGGRVGEMVEVKRELEEK